MQHLQPALDVERFDVLGNLTSPSGTEIGADNMFSDGSSVFRFRAHGILAKVGFQVVLRKCVKPGANVARQVVDANQQPESIDLAPCVFLFREIPNETDGQGVFNPSAIRLRDPITQHPVFSSFAMHLS